MKNLNLIVLLTSFVIVSFLNAQIIEVIGLGVKENSSPELMFENISNIDKIVVEAVFKDNSYYDGPVKFINGTTEFEVGPVEGILDYGRNGNGDPLPLTSKVYFTTTLYDISSKTLTLDKLNNVGGIQSFIAYIYRNDPDAYYYSLIEEQHVFFYRNNEYEKECESLHPSGNPPGPYTYIFDIPTSDIERDITVKIPISELADDGRNCFFELSDGDQPPVLVELYNYNLEKSLRIEEISLNNVSGDVTQISLKIWSPCDEDDPKGGDSFITSGVVLNVYEKKEEPQEYCTLTQGFYGNYGGLYKGMTTFDLLFNLLESDLIIGYNGNSLTFTQDDVDCLIGRLPGGGKSKRLNGEATCGDPVGIKLHSDGRFKNSAVAQTITLGLNLRLENNPGNLTLAELPFELPDKIWNYLGGNATVFDLLDLANSALAGDNVGEVKLDEITEAIEDVNDYFDECITFTQGGDCGPCAGKMNSLTLEYLGDLNNVLIKVYDKEIEPDKLIEVFENVQIGDVLTFIGTGDNNKFGSKVRLTINEDEDNYTEIHTSCSETIEVGMVYGGINSGIDHFLLLAGSSVDGGPLCDDGGEDCGPCDGQMTSLTFEYLGNVSNATIKAYKDKVETDKLLGEFPNKNNGDSFSFVGVGKHNKVGAKVRITINDEDDNYTEIHTSCSEPIEIGMIYMDKNGTTENFLLLAGTSHEGGPLCEEGTKGGTSPWLPFETTSSENSFDNNDTESDVKDVIQETSLHAFPNPTSGYTTVEFTSEFSIYTTIELYNFRGNKVETFFTGIPLSDQKQTLNINVNSLQPGYYFLLLRNSKDIKRMMLEIK